MREILMNFIWLLYVSRVEKMWPFLVLHFFLSVVAGKSIAPDTNYCPCGGYNRLFSKKETLMKDLCTSEERKKMWFRILGGFELKTLHYPFMVSLEKEGNEHFCGGSIITPSHVLTGAHCQLRTKMFVRVGVWSLKSKQGSLYNVKSFIPHEEFSQATLANDIGIIVTEVPMKQGMDVRPVCLPTPSQSLPAGQRVITLGWGLLDYIGHKSQNLQEICVPVDDFGVCHHSWTTFPIPNPPFKDMNFCTYERGKDACKGDSGGPLVMHDPVTDRWTLVGLVSYGMDCGGDLPGVNINVQYYMPWINKQIAYSNVGFSTCSNEDKETRSYKYKKVSKSYHG